LSNGPLSSWVIFARASSARASVIKSALIAESVFWPAPFASSAWRTVPPSWLARASLS
jgi:hypothetical protein